jgi:hypothetical protein
MRVMRDKHSTHTWIGGFAARLLQLCPGFSVVQAVNCAVESLHDSEDAEPRQAAEDFARSHFAIEGDASALKNRIGRLL